MFSLETFKPCLCGSASCKSCDLLLHKDFKLFILVWLFYPSKTYKNHLSQTFYKLLCIYINIKWHLFVTRWTMHGPLTKQRDSGLTLGSTLRPVWLDQTPVVQKVAPSVCGSMWLIVVTYFSMMVELSHLFRMVLQQDHWSFATMRRSGMTHMYLLVFHTS